MNALDVTVHGVGDGTPVWQQALGWLIPGIVAVIGVFVGQRYTQWREDRNRYHDRRRELYTEFLQALTDTRSRLALAEAFASKSGNLYAGWRGIVGAIKDGLPPVAETREAYERGQVLLTEVDLLARKPALVDSAREALTVSLRTIEEFHRWDGESESDYLRFYVMENSQLCRWCTREMRRELGLKAGSEANPLDPLPSLPWWSTWIVMQAPFGRGSRSWRRRTSRRPGNGPRQ